MGSQATNEFTSAAYVFTDLSVDFPTMPNDPRANNAREGRPNRALLVVGAGSLHVTTLEGTSIDIDGLPAGTLVPIVAATVLAGSTATVLVLY